LLGELSLKKPVWITLIYGDVEETKVFKDLFNALNDLRKLGLEPVIVQVFVPGSKLRINVNGVELSIDEKLAENIVSVALDTTISEDVIENYGFLKYVAASTEKE